MATVPSSQVQRFILDGISWEKYRKVLRLLDDRHLRITYDRGRLELITLSPQHERLKHLLAFLIVALVEELGWEWASYGSMTFKRRKRRRGLEPDDCFWIQSEPLVRGKDKIDLRLDPPPDLVLEIEVTHSALDRLSIYAALRIPEVWCFDGQALRVYILGSDGRYAESPISKAFAFLPLKDMAHFLGLRFQIGNAALVRSFRAWVRDQIARNWQ
jgi:Uma2 family endonuclease